MNKAPGADKLCSTLLRKIVEVIRHPLSLIFTESLEKQQIPNDWKKANVTPSFKKGSRSKPANYRPARSV